MSEFELFNQALNEYEKTTNKIAANDKKTSVLFLLLKHSISTLNESIFLIVNQIL